jgi:exopolyphosphatase/pppGpp-phosphohydrolase
LIGLGQATLTTRFFEGDVISPGRLEQAIEWTEDQIQTASTNFPAGAQLVTVEDVLRELALVSGVSPSAHMVLHVEAVEATFSRLVIQAFGQAPQQEALLTSARFFATVVFIRELMHHLHFPQHQP